MSAQRVKDVYKGFKEVKFLSQNRFRGDWVNFILFIQLATEPIL